MTDTSETELLRERLKEYRKLLEFMYSMLSNPEPPSDEVIGKFVARLEEHGIGSTDDKPRSGAW